MSIVRQLNIAPVLRTEGDLDVQVWLREGNVAQVRVQTRLFEGLPQLLKGKIPAAALQMAPRICGACGGAHSYSAAFAMDAALCAALPYQAALLRGITQMLENLQSVPRWFYPQFAPELTHPHFARLPQYGEVQRRFTRYAGAAYAAGLRAAAHIVDIYGLLAGPWPGAALMTPGGVIQLPPAAALTQARALLDAFRRDWLEPVWLGDTVETYLSLSNWSELTAWVRGSEGDLAVFLRAGLEGGLDRMGQGLSRFLAMGTFIHPDLTAENRSESLVIPGGWCNEGRYLDFDPTQLRDYDPSIVPEGAPYRKAPKYEGQSAETGALARAVMMANPDNASHQVRDSLFGDILRTQGSSALVRALARVHEMVRLYVLLDEWLDRFEPEGVFQLPPTAHTGRGFGATEAARGALAHWVDVEAGMIRRYEVLPPTLWNAGPLDAPAEAGPYAAALLGTKVASPEQPVELDLVMRSFDTCLLYNIRVMGAVR